jgi:twinkle protein
MEKQDNTLDFSVRRSVPHSTIKVNGATNATATEYLKGRGIAEEVIKQYTIQDTYRFNGNVVPSVGFPYRHDGEVAAIKWRSASDEKKYYSQQNVCEDFFGLDQFIPGNDILLVEGEMDALSWLSCKLPENLTVLSIPNGAPAKVRDEKVSPKEDKKFRYLWRAKEQLDSAKRILLCFDADKPGLVLKDEIIRRLGNGKDIWTVDLGGFKDTSEAFTEKGEAYLIDKLECAVPLPTVGLYGVEEFQPEFTKLYEDGQIKGVAPGIPSLDKLIQIVPGMVTVVTGFPSSGKSDLIDQICLNLARNHGWKTVYSSFEKPPSLHLAQLSQKLVDMPFFEGPSTRMTREQRDWACEFCQEHFLFMDHTRQGPTTIDGILEVASKAVMRMGCRVLVIDPYNHLEMPTHDKETDAISKMLTSVQQWCRMADAHCFFIAHPTKLAPDRRSQKKVLVTGHDIAGSAAWFAKADIGLTAWRHPQDSEPPEAHVWKVRWSWLGRQGFCQLDFDRSTGRWSDHVREIVDEAYWDL